MDREQIIEATRNLPAVEIGQHHERSQVFRGIENGAHFQVSRNIVRDRSGQVELLSLSVFGNQNSAEELIEDFTDIFGSPYTSNILNGPEGVGILVIVWLIRPNEPKEEQLFPAL